MAKRAKTKARRRAVKARRRTGKNTRSRKAPKARRSVKRPSKKTKVKRPQKPRKQAATARTVPATSPRLNRVRRVLTDPVPSSSLDVDRFTAAARSGRKALDRSLHEHHDMSPAITGGDLDADWENAYFSGDEAPGGDNLTPDQENVEDMAEALGLSYQDNEELKGSDKVVERDKHRWELDPASADDYKKDRE
jgi:Family of unknown function (DUF6335)